MLVSILGLTSLFTSRGMAFLLASEDNQYLALYGWANGTLTKLQKLESKEVEDYLWGLGDSETPFSFPNSMLSLPTIY